MSSILDQRNPRAPRVGSTLDSRNPRASGINRDPRVYSVDTPYSEFPKWVRLPDGSGIIVHSEAEERVALGEMDEHGNDIVREDSSGDGITSPVDVDAGNVASVVVHAVKKAGPPSKAERDARSAAALAELKS